MDGQRINQGKLARICFALSGVAIIGLSVDSAIYSRGDRVRASDSSYLLPRHYLELGMIVTLGTFGLVSSIRSEKNWRDYGI